MASGRKVREFHEYLERPRKVISSHNDYVVSPATAFLGYTVEAKDAVAHCKNNFPKKQNNHYTQASDDALAHILIAFLPAIMGHFETFQRYLFAGMFEGSRFIENFKLDAFIKRIEKNRDIHIDPLRVSAYRGLSAQAGFMIADSLNGWHDPDVVNSYFSAFELNTIFYSKDDSERIRSLWQLRHSIVHTGCYLTRPDSQKVKALRNLGDSDIGFSPNFIFEVSRKMHRIVRDSVGRLGSAYKNRLPTNLTAPERKQIDDLFQVKSSIGAWMK